MQGALMTGYDRRRFIAYALPACAAICAGASARGACVDPDELSSSAQSMRESLEYTDAAADPKQTCKHCAYFKFVNAGDSCAPCEVFATPVSAAGHCVSWTKRG